MPECGSLTNPGFDFNRIKLSKINFTNLDFNGGKV